MMIAPGYGLPIIQLRLVVTFILVIIIIRPSETMNMSLKETILRGVVKI